jgi:CheY-like chemotaxis protein
MDKAQDKTVLVVEDEPDVQAFLAATLEDAGFNVLTASNGQDGYNRVKEKRPDAITLDLVMPRQSGVQFYKRLRANAKYTDIPVLIITAHARDDLGQEDFAEIMKSKEVAAPQGYLEKPVNPVALVDKIASMLGVEVDDFVDDTRGEVLAKLRNADLDTLHRVKDLLGKP